jgi:hypothetical protein
VKIRLPDEILAQLGFDLVEQEALAGKMVKMTEGFRTEMLHHIVPMLAEHLDAPAKVRDCIQTIVAAGTSLHVEVA